MILGAGNNPNLEKMLRGSHGGKIRGRSRSSNADCCALLVMIDSWAVTRIHSYKCVVQRFRLGGGCMGCNGC